MHPCASCLVRCSVLSGPQATGHPLLGNTGPQRQLCPWEPAGSAHSDEFLNAAGARRNVASHGPWSWGHHPQDPTFMGSATSRTCPPAPILQHWSGTHISGSMVIATCGTTVEVQLWSPWAVAPRVPVCPRLFTENLICVCPRPVRSKWGAGIFYGPRGMGTPAVPSTNLEAGDWRAGCTGCGHLGCSSLYRPGASGLLRSPQLLPVRVPSSSAPRFQGDPESGLQSIQLEPPEPHPGCSMSGLSL